MIGLVTNVDFIKFAKHAVPKFRDSKIGSHNYRRIMFNKFIISI